MPNLTFDALERLDCERDAKRDTTRALPQVIQTDPSWAAPYSTGGSVEEAPMTPQAVGAMRAPTRVYTLPDPTVGGYAEWSRPVGRTVDPAISGFFRNVPFEAQGSYDAVPTWNNEPAQGMGTPNIHGRKLRAGILNQLGGYQPPAPASYLPYVAALSNIPTYNTLDQIVT